jgi:hypothetical protein
MTVSRWPPDYRVDAVARRSNTFAPRGLAVGARGGDPAGPTKLVDANRDRISLMLKAPASNTSTIFLGGDGSVLAQASAPGTPPTRGDNLELEPGESLVIDDTTAAVWAVAPQGFAGQVIKVIEQLDPGPRR